MVEVIERALGAPQFTANEIWPATDIQRGDSLSTSFPTSVDILNHHNSDFPAENPSTSGARNNIRLASLDLDYPALLSTSEAASQRVPEAEILFGPISNILDLQCQTHSEHMPVRHLRAINDLREELTVLARRNFEACVRSSSAQL
ncbi:hypothetical protein EPUL_003330 [Erysiphe pulchra]|uniref:Uncharacterized protein n=1 Tax=Erysiphe pulchra TaxID=225359 RepID=A0A2S4PTE6_9PEZI|nr:hypothetical protein EPUL_003330 [Erysiphe pulchra]